MQWLNSFLLSAAARYDDLSVSIEEHIEERIEELMEDGMPRDAGRAKGAARVWQCGPDEERSREVWQWRALESHWPT